MERLDKIFMGVGVKLFPTVMKGLHEGILFRSCRILEIARSALQQGARTVNMLNLPPTNFTLTPSPPC